jgi:hypothetical protein
MVDRYRAPGGWSVQVIHLTATSDNRDGEWLRVSYCGVWVADVRSPGELEQWFPLASLEEEVLVLRAKGHPRGSEGWITLSKLFRRQPNWCVIVSRVWFIAPFKTSRTAIAWQAVHHVRPHFSQMAIKVPLYRSSLGVTWVAWVSSDEVPGYLYPRWRRCF